MIRVWKLPVESLLEGGLGTLPLAPISAITAEQLPGVLERMKERLGRPRVRSHAGKILGAAYVLMGLRYEQALIDRVFQGVLQMEESVTYQAILKKGLEQGRAQGARKVVLFLGKQKFGVAPRLQILAALEAISDLEQLEQLASKVQQVESWEELLPPAPRRSRRPKGGS